MNTKISLQSLVSVGLLFATATALAGSTTPPRNTAEPHESS